MKQISSRHTFHGKKRHDFISLFSIILLLWGLFVLVYLLSFCHRTDNRYTPFFQTVLAREETKGEVISEAGFLSANANHRISLPPYSHKYYYIKYQRNYSIQILSGSPSVKMKFYTDSGNPLNIPRKNHSYYLGKISENIISSGERIFLKFSSNTTKTCVIKVQYRRTPKKEKIQQKQPTPRPKKKTFNKRAQAAPTRSPAKNTSPTAEKTPSPAKKLSPTTNMPSPTAKNVPPTTSKPLPKKKIQASATKMPSPTAENPSQNLYKLQLHTKPHFIRLTPSSRKELSLACGNLSVTLADCTYFLTDSSIVSLKNNTVTGEIAGITILYFKEKQSAACGSCLIRVIGY